MSRIGEKPLHINSNVQIAISEGNVHVKGPKGEMNVHIPAEIIVEKSDDTLKVSRKLDTKKVRALHGLIRNLIANAVKGVETPWEKVLEVVGTGFRVKKQGNGLVFDVGYSHSVPFEEVEHITFTVDGQKVTVSGVDKQKVGEVAHKIRVIRKPDAYKGKGIRYEGEVLHLKPGKKAKVA